MQSSTMNSNVHEDAKFYFDLGGNSRIISYVTNILVENNLQLIRTRLTIQAIHFNETLYHRQGCK
jgi:hypothetical protein